MSAGAVVRAGRVWALSLLFAVTEEWQRGDSVVRGIHTLSLDLYKIVTSYHLLVLLNIDTVVMDTDNVAIDTDNATDGSAMLNATTDNVSLATSMDPHV